MLAYRASRAMAQAAHWKRKAEAAEAGAELALAREAWRRAGFYTRQATEAIKELRGEKA